MLSRIINRARRPLRSLIRTKQVTKYLQTGHQFFRNSQVATVARYNSYGAPDKVITIEKEKLPEPSREDILVEMLYAPINTADTNTVEGIYGVKPTLPAIPGNEGVAKVIKVGDKVHDVSPGDIVVPANPGFGTWRSHAVVDQYDVIKIPQMEGVKIEYLASLSVNPSTAWRLLEDFVKLKEGDVIVQNGANSQVGSSLLQIANGRGIKTINIVRERPDYPEVVERLKAYGGYIVVRDSYVRTTEFKRLISDLPAPKLALNMVGGDSATDIARLLVDGGTMVTYGGMSRKPVTVPTSLLIFKNISLKGFWLTKWVKEHSREEKLKMYTGLMDLMKKDKPGHGLRLWSEIHKFSKFKQALEANNEQYRGRKILLSLQE